MCVHARLQVRALMGARADGRAGGRTYVRACGRAYLCECGRARVRAYV